MSSIQTLSVIGLIIICLLVYIVYLLIQVRREYIRLEKALRKRFHVKMRDLMNNKI